MKQLTDENSKLFLQDLKNTCNENNIKLFVGKGKKVNCGGSFSSGYFSGEDKVLGIASDLKSELFLPVLIHESSHLDQFLENCKEWRDYNKLSYDYSFNDIIKGKTPIDPYKYCRVIAKLEWDCEKRSIEKIKQYNLNIDIKTYSKMANAYVYFWLHLPEIKIWFKKGRKAPYMQKQLLNVCPQSLGINFKDTIPPRVLTKLNLIYNC